MAEPAPTGKLLATESGRDLVLTRLFDDGIEAVWATLTEPERSARWFGPWSGEGMPGGKIACRMAFEEGEPEIEMSVLACERPQHLALFSEDEYGSWHLEVHLRERDGGTELDLVHHLDEKAEPGSIGPGWEWYLDRFVAAHVGGPSPEFGDYFPAQQAYYEGLVPE